MSIRSYFEGRYENIPGPLRSLIAAFVLVTVGVIEILFFEDPAAQRHWSAVFSAPVMPAVSILTLFFIGGAHGIGWSRNHQLVAVFYIALIMWWIAFEACRLVWGVVRRRTHVP